MKTARLKSPWPAIHGGVFLAAMVLIPVCLPRLPWPWYLLLPLLAYTGAVLVVPSLRRTVPILRAGRFTGIQLGAALALSALTSGVLLAYQALVHPDVSSLAAALPVAAFGNLFLAGVWFTACNAVLEELVFRGVLYEAVAAEWGAAVAVGITAACFGLSHLQGYPPGPTGAVLAGLYGMALGLLRWWSGGLGWRSPVTSARMRRSSGFWRPRGLLLCNRPY
jgi:membrane protease YdiL (CAAX protease family)